MPLPSAGAAVASLKKAYAPYPGPDATLFGYAEAVSALLSDANVKTEGVIAMALSNFKPTDGRPPGYLYCFFSPSLHDAVMAKYKTIPALGKALAAVTDDRPSILKVKVDGGGDVSPQILTDAGNHNPGCAEKKLLTAVQSYKEKIVSFAVVAHPANKFSPKNTSAHIILGSANATYIGPCESCLAVGVKHKATFA